MTNEHIDLSHEYREGLVAYLGGAGEQALDVAYELGRRAIRLKFGVLEITRMHQAAIEAVLTKSPHRPADSRRIYMASAFLSEAMAPFEMTQRGYQETLDRLVRLTETLEAQVEDRTQELRVAEARYRSLVEQLPAITYVGAFHEGNRTTYISPQVEYILGFSPEEWLADLGLWERLLHPDDRDTVLSHLQERLSVGEGVDLDYRMLTKHGRVVWLHNQAVVVSDSDGKPQYSLGLLFDVTERKLRETELMAIASVSSALRSAHTRAEMIALILDRVLELLHADAAACALLHEDSGTLEVELLRGVWSQQSGGEFRQQWILEQVITGGVPYVNNDVTSDPKSRAADGGDGLGAFAAVPLLVENHPIGAVLVANHRGFSSKEVHLLASIADIAANAIRRVSLFERTNRHLRRLSALRIIDQAISASQELKQTLEVVLIQVLEQLEVDAASFFLWDKDTHILECVAGRGFRDPIVGRTYQHPEAVVTGRVALSRNAVHLSSLSSPEREDPHFALLDQEGFVAYDAEPLIIKTSVKGVLEVYHRKVPHRTKEWLDFLETLAGQAAIAVEESELLRGLQRSNDELVAAYDATIEGWSRALDLRDRETEGHSLRVTAMSVRLAQTMGLPPSAIRDIQRGALLHDIGKMGIPDSILLKPGPLSEEEWTIMKRHPGYAYEMLSPIRYLQASLDIPFCHHEKWDGSGYPRGLRGEEIPLSARIFAIVDVWDALRSDRPYRKCWPSEKVRELIISEAGKHFDPAVVESFLTMQEN